MPIGMDIINAKLDAAYGATEKLPLKLGYVTRGDDARRYILAKASADVPANTIVIVTEPAFTFATGAGSWTTQGTAVTNGQVVWLKSTAI